MSRLALRINSALKRMSFTHVLIFVAFIVVVQFVLIGQMVADQRDSEHIVDINGAQRMRTQRIAYLALAARTGHAPRDWRTELRRAVDEMLFVQRELLDRHNLSSTPVDKSGATVAERTMFRYALAARAIGRSPHDDAAFAYIDANRTGLLAAVEEKVEARTRIVKWHNAQLIVGLIAGLGIVLATMVLALKRIVEPNERRTADLVAKLNNSEAQMRSLFRENPDSIAIYDVEGRIVRGNRACGTLLGPMTEGLVGAHFLRHTAPSEEKLVSTSFARALSGENVAFDTLFVDTGGEHVDVQATLFANVLNGVTVGVIGVAKDMRGLRRAEAAYLAQAERITELYRVAGNHKLSAKRQVEETLAVAAQRLGYDWAAATEIVDGDARAMTVVGDAGFDDGDLIALPKSLIGRAKRARDVWSIDDLSQSSLRNEPVLRMSRWATLVGVPISIGSATYGSLLLGSARARTTTFEAADRDFLRLVSTLIGANIQRGQHEQKLDALAFFDSLTGLPNRVLLADRMTECLNVASRRNLKFAVHFLDLDRFKTINDTSGHAAGDEALRIAARRMEQCTRGTDTVARVGGDEFVILQALDPAGHGANELAERVRAAIAKPFQIDDVEHDLGVSIGISIFPADGTDASTLLRTADEALLRAKQTSRQPVDDLIRLT